MMRTGPRPIARAAGRLILAGPLMTAWLFGAGQSMAGKAVTVNGPVPASDLGITLMHEHLLSDFRLPDESPETWAASGRRRPRTPEKIRLYGQPVAMNILGSLAMGEENRDNWLLDDEKTAVAELKEFKYFGGRTLVDLTNNGLKRDPRALRRISEAAGTHIVMGAGWYRRAWAGDRIDKLSVADLAATLMREIRVGVDDTGIRAGIIGEISPADPRSDYDRKVLQAAARAGRATGAPISLSLPLGGVTPRSIFEALDVLESAGAALDRVAVGHADLIALDMPFVRRLLDRGVYLQFDRLGDPPQVLTQVGDHDVALAIVALIEQGFGGRILLSQDVNSKIDLKAYGGSGYAFLLEQYAPYVRTIRPKGITTEQMHMILVENPRRLLAFAAPRED